MEGWAEMQIYIIRSKTTQQAQCPHQFSFLMKKFHCIQSEWTLDKPCNSNRKDRSTAKENVNLKCNFFQCNAATELLNCLLCKKTTNFKTFWWPMKQLVFVHELHYNWHKVEDRSRQKFIRMTEHNNGWRYSPTEISSFTPAVQLKRNFMQKNEWVWEKI